MEKIEIDRQLALAIGYLPEDVRTIAADSKAGCVKVLRDTGGFGKWWSDFDHTDPSVAWPLAKHYKCFPIPLGERKWAIPQMSGVVIADTPEEAVAMAIIKGSRK